MISKVLHKDLVSIAVFRLIVFVGRRLVGVFIPLLLLQKGMEVWHVCAFYAGYAASKVSVTFLSARLINRSGIRFGLAIGSVSSSVFLALLALYVATGRIWILASAALAMAFQDDFCWVAEKLHISRNIDTTRKGRDLAVMGNALRVVGITMPTVGGFVAALLGQVWLTAVAAGIVTLAIIPIWRIDTLGHQEVDKLRCSVREAPLRDVVSMIGLQADTFIGWYFWPLYLAVCIPSFSSIGVVTTGAALIAAMAAYFAGKRGDGGSRQRVLVEGVLACSILHLVRVFASANPVMILIISGLYNIADGHRANSWASLYFAHAKKGGIRYIVAMELASDFTNLGLWSFLGVVAYFASESIFFQAAFIIVAALALLTLAIRREAPMFQ